MEPPRNGPSYAELRERIRELEARITELNLEMLTTETRDGKRIEALEAALRKYGSHKRNACIFAPLTRDGKGGCVCGLEDALSTIPSPTSKGDGK